MSGSIAGTTANGGTGTSRQATPRLSADLNTFLTLLTTQLRNQDPTKPMDAEAMTQQLVQFATVEQQIRGNQTLEQLVGLQQAGQLAGAANLVGRRVVAESDRLPLQDGRGEVVLPAAGRAQRATIEIRDQSGTLLRRETVTLGQQQRSWSWDGRDASGRSQPDGAYRLTVTGSAADGTRVELAPVVAGRVTGAARVDGDLVLRLGRATVGFDRLRELPNG